MLGFKLFMEPLKKIFRSIWNAAAIFSGKKAFLPQAKEFAKRQTSCVLLLKDWMDR